MILEIKTIEIRIGENFKAIDFIKGSTQFGFNSQVTSQGVIYECKLRFACTEKVTIASNHFLKSTQFRVTHQGGVVNIGTLELPVTIQLESIEPTVYIVKHLSPTTYI